MPKQTDIVIDQMIPDRGLSWRKLRDWERTLDDRYLLLTGSLDDVTNHSHTLLDDIGTNTHAQIDTFIGTTVPGTYLKLDQTTPQTTTGTFTFPSVIATNYLKTPKIYPSADSATAIQILKADGTTSIFNVDTTNARVGIGTTAPATTLNLAKANSTHGLYIDEYSTTTTTRSILAFRKSSNNTLGSMTKTQNGDLIGQFIAYGTNDLASPAFENAAGIFFYQDGAVGAGSTRVPGKMSFWTSNGSTDIVEKMVLTKDGYLGLGVTAPSSMMNIAKANSTYGLYLDQYSTTTTVRPQLAFRKSNSNTLGTMGTTQDGDLLGQFIAFGTNNLATPAFENAVGIFFYQDGAVIGGSQRVPGKMSFWTSNGSLDIAERMVLTKDGYLGIGSTAPAARLQVNGAASGITSIFQANATTPGNITEWRNSSGTILSLVNSAGGFVINENGDATADFRVESDTESNMVYLDANGDTDGSLYLGGTTNGIKINKGGELTLIGTATRWEDLRVEPTARGTGARNPAFEQYMDDSGLGDTGTSIGCYLYSFDDAAAGSEKEVWFNMQMPHQWAGTGIYIHVHWIGSVNDTTSAPRWGLEFAWKEIGATYAGTTTIYTDGSNYTGSSTDANITAGIHYISKFAVQAPGTSADGLSSILIGRLFRNSSSASDTYDAAGNKCGLLYIDAHYELNDMGSSQEYVK